MKIKEIEERDNGLKTFRTTNNGEVWDIEAVDLAEATTKLTAIFDAQDNPPPTDVEKLTQLLVDKGIATPQEIKDTTGIDVEQK